MNFDSVIDHPFVTTSGDSLRDTDAKDYQRERERESSISTCVMALGGQMQILKYNIGTALEIREKYIFFSVPGSLFLC